MQIILCYLLITSFSLAPLAQSTSCITIKLKSGYTMNAQFDHADDNNIHIVDNTGKSQIVKRADVQTFQLNSCSSGTVKPAVVKTLPPNRSSGNNFQVRYNGGTVESSVKPGQWGNYLSVASGEITLRLKDGQSVSINPHLVQGLSYGKNASRNIKGYAAAAIILNPLFALGMLKKNKQHFIGITYLTASGERGAILVQAKNDQYRSLLEALKGVTGKDVDTDEKGK